MLTRIVVTALKDEARILGLILPYKGYKLDVDISDDQLETVQKAVDSGEVEVEGMSKAERAPDPLPDPVPAPAPLKKGKDK
jgi:hypothetical protein